jgi:hypothetical protein
MKMGSSFHRVGAFRFSCQYVACLASADLPNSPLENTRNICARNVVASRLHRKGSLPPHVLNPFDET